MAFKESTEEWVRKGPTQAIALVAAAGLVVGAILGLGAGFKIEQNRTRSDVKRLKAELNGAGSSVNASGPVGQRQGKVTATAADSITMSTNASGTLTVHTTSATTNEKAVPGALSDIVKGSRVLITVGAREIIVLSPSSKLGREITDVSKSTISFKKDNGSGSGKIKSTDVRKVETIKPATAADIKTGIHVIAAGRPAGKGNFNAIEIIVLPTGSAFAT